MSDWLSSTPFSEISGSEESSKLVPPFVSYAFIVNFVQGGIYIFNLFLAGILAMPYAFFKAGLVLSTIFMFVLTVLAIITMIWEIETMARANLKRSVDLILNSKEHTVRTEKREWTGETDHQSLSNNGQTIWSSQILHWLSIDNKWGIEVNELCNIFIGPWAKTLYDISLILYSIAGLWAYVAIFSGSVSVSIPVPGYTNFMECNVYDSKNWTSHCEVAYIGFTALFGIIMIILVLKDVSEQGKLQAILTCFAFFCIILMVITLVTAAYKQPFMGNQQDILDPRSPHHQKPPYFDPDVPLFQMSGFALLFSTAIFSQLGHQGIPNLVRIMERKHLAKRIFSGALFTTMSIYCCLGILAASYFGSATDPQITLDWEKYTGENTSDKAARTVSHILRFLISIYPAIPISAAYPLFAIVLGNTLATVLSTKSLAFMINPKDPDSVIPRIGHRPINEPLSMSEHTPLLVESESESINNSSIEDISTPKRDFSHDHRAIAICRLIAAIPPLFLGAIIKNLAVVVGFTGLFGFWLAFLLPCLMEIKSIQWCKENSAKIISLAENRHLKGNNTNTESEGDSVLTPSDHETLTRLIIQTQHGSFITSSLAAKILLVVSFAAFVMAVYLKFV